MMKLTSCNMETFSATYSLMQDNNYKNISDEILDFRHSFLHKYMCRTFQCVDPNPMSYRSSLIRRVCYICRPLSLALVWVCFVFNLYFFAKSYQDTVSVGPFTMAVTFVFHMVKNARFVVLHNMGMSLFARHPDYVVNIMKRLKKNVESSQDLIRLKEQLKNRHRKINILIGLTLFCLTVLPFLQILGPVIIELTTTIPSDGYGKLDFLEYTSMFYTRMVSLPFLFYMIHISSLQGIELDEYKERSTRTRKRLDDLFQEYMNIHRGIKTTAAHFHTYLSVLTLITFVWGALTAYTTANMFKRVVSDNSNDGFTLIIFEIVSSFVLFTVEVVLLFTLPWYNLTKVSEKQRKVISKFLEIPYSKMEDTDSPFKSVEDVFSFTARVEKHQDIDGMGYSVFGVTLTKLRLMWALILGPLCIFIGNATIKGKFN